jgi:toxin ParE1/3/4
LADLWNYYAQAAGQKVADDIVRKIDGACSMLAVHPYAGRARNEVRPGLRCVVTAPHVVFYRIVDDVAEIVRVIDGRRDIDEIFDQPARDAD